MYKPRSPIASSKSINFSPSPANRRKGQIAKGMPQPSPKQRASNQASENRPEKKPMGGQGKPARMKNLEVDTNELIESLRINECPNANNETPKFCLKP